MSNRVIWLRAISIAVFLVAMSAPSAQAQQTTTYTYDELGRLITIARSDGVTIQYSYDPAGNRTSQVVSGSIAAPPVTRVIVVPLNGFTIIPIQ